MEETPSLLSSARQEELAAMRWQLEGKDGETRRLQDETGFRAIASSSSDPAERGGKTSPMASGTDDEHA